MLLEFLTSFPVYIVLLVSLFAVWLFFLKSYVVLLGDWELQQEMRLALERIAQREKKGEGSTAPHAPRHRGNATSAELSIDSDADVEHTPQSSAQAEADSEDDTKPQD